VMRSGREIVFLFITLWAIGWMSGCKYFDPDANFIEDHKVWAKIKKEAPPLGLDPNFVYAICHAESSLNANAQSSIARGMMQLTEAAWSDVTNLHYRTAFQWETNIEVGMLYLERLKGMLESVDMFNYPRLAASYRYGYNALRQEQYMVSRMKTPINRIYRKLFAGQLSPVEPPEN
jgi:soluble lytic murein transglycosylase-like protein